MRTMIMSLNNWPRRKNNEYIFQSTEEAFFFANLALDKPDVISSLKRGRAIALKNISQERVAGFPNLQRMMDLAVKAQFFRECLEEVDRIKKEVPKDDKA